MENQSGKCLNCEFFDRYYTKEVKRFNKTKYGLCQKKGDATGINDSCDKFIQKKRTKTDSCLLGYYLSDLLTEISEIRKVIEAELSENEEV